MEKISTPRADLLPRSADLATLAVVVAAMWWSGAQRPAGQPIAGTAGAVLAKAEQPADGTTARQPATPVTAGDTTAATAMAVWPAQAGTTIARDGLQAVGFQTRTR